MVRVATSDDDDALVELAMTWDGPPAFRPTEPALRELLAHARSLDHVLMVNESRGRIAGFLLAIVLQHPLRRQSCGEIVAWYDQSGHGSALLRSAEGWARRRELCGLQAACPTDARRLERLYDARGYRALERVMWLEM